jgi:hypothetical protein
VTSLGKSGSATLNAAGTGTVRFGPSDSNRGPQTWDIDAFLWETTRAGSSAAGIAPIPRIQIYIDTTDPANKRCQSYDGSFGAAHGTETIRGNQQVVAVWTGGQSGDIATLTVTGEAR